MNIVQFLPAFFQIAICTFFIWQNYKIKKENFGLKWMLTQMPLEDLERLRREKPSGVHLHFMDT